MSSLPEFVSHALGFNAAKRGRDLSSTSPVDDDVRVFFSGDTG